MDRGNGTYSFHPDENLPFHTASPLPVIGSGGYGWVCQALHKRLQQPIAVKVFKGEYEESSESFEDEVLFYTSLPKRPYMPKFIGHGYTAIDNTSW